MTERVPDLQRVASFQLPASTGQFSPDGQYILGTDDNGRLELWRMEIGQKPLTLRGFRQAIYNTIYSPDGRLIASTGEYKVVKIWNATNGQAVTTFEGHRLYEHNSLATVTSAAFNSDGRFIVTGSSIGPGEDTTGQVLVWDPLTGEIKHNFAGLPSGVNSVAFSPDSRYVVAGCDDGQILLWDITLDDTSSADRIFPAHVGSVRSVAFSPDGHHLISAGDDATAKVWASATGQLQYTLVHEAAVGSAVYSPDGKHIITASKDKAAYIWDAQTGQEIRILRGHSQAVYNARYSPDGTRIITAKWAHAYRNCAPLASLRHCTAMGIYSPFRCEGPVIMGELSDAGSWCQSWQQVHGALLRCKGTRDVSLGQSKQSI